MHPEANRGIAAMVAALPTPPRRVYEIGSLNINGSVRPLFSAAEQYHGIDLHEGPGVDAVADGLTYVPPFEPDCIVCSQVLEHAPDWQALLAQMARVVAVEGVVLIACAGPLMIPHAAATGYFPPTPGEYYQGLTRWDVRRAMRRAGLAEIKTFHAGRFDLTRHSLVKQYTLDLHPTFAVMSAWALRVTIPYIDTFAWGRRAA